LAGSEKVPRAPEWVCRSPLEADAVVLVVDGPITPADVPALGDRALALLEGTGAGVIACDVRAVVDPDTVVVDALARLQLVARRLGSRLRLLNASQELWELLALMGLDGVLSCGPASVPEARRQPEEREQTPGVQEEGDPGDPIA
jgi:anti-anti-sigma regulatory factor